MVGRLYSEILQPVDFTPGGHQALLHQGESEVEYKCTYNHDRDVAYDYWANDQNAECSYSEHNACNTAVPTTPNKEHSIRVDEIILRRNECQDGNQGT